jgi:hypothetical protein
MDYAAPAVLNTYYVTELTGAASGFQSSVCTGDDNCVYDDGLAG